MVLRKMLNKEYSTIIIIGQIIQDLKALGNGYLEGILRIKLKL